jgi:hypothetical protein
VHKYRLDSVTGAWTCFARAVVAELGGDLEGARQEFEPLAALDTCPGHAAVAPSLARAHLAVLIAASEPDRSRELATTSLEELRSRLGDEHPETRSAEAFVATLH